MNKTDLTWEESHPSNYMFNKDSHTKLQKTLIKFKKNLETNKKERNVTEKKSCI